MEITEKQLLDGFDGITNGLDNISLIHEQKIIWAYRRREENYTPVCERDTADIITLEYDRTGNIDLVPDNTTHPAIAKMQQLRNEVYGNLVA